MNLKYLEVFRGVREKPSPNRKNINFLEFKTRKKLHRIEDESLIFPNNVGY